MTRRSHRRASCFGGSQAMSDPMVIEIAGSSQHLPSVSVPIQGALASASVDILPAESPAELDELAQLDEQLQIAAGDSGTPPSAGHRAEAADLRFKAFTLDLLKSVRLPTLRALGTASLEPLRAAIAAITEERDAERCAACHIILGGALRLRSERKQGYQRAQLLIEATRAFDTAYGIYATLRHAAAGEVDLREVGMADAITRGVGCRPAAPCIRERDGTTLVARAVAGPAGTNSHLLERAVAYLRLTRAGAEMQSWAWVSSTNNLACALTLLGNRTPAAAGSAMLTEAAQVLREALNAHAAGYRREERGSTLINLAEALLSMAERETPDLRTRKIERAFTASSVALLSVVPPALAWLVRAARRELE